MSNQSSIWASFEHGMNHSSAQHLEFQTLEVLGVDKTVTGVIVNSVITSEFVYDGDASVSKTFYKKFNLIHLLYIITIHLVIRNMKCETLILYLAINSKSKV